MDQSFWRNLSAPTDTGCLEWQGYRLANGYGQVQRNSVKYQAHRYAWQEVNGPIPDGLIICHRCDNPPCCNPKHLWLGTPKDNIQDMLAKRRGMQGEKMHLAKLTEPQIAAIRADDRTSKEIAPEYGVCWSSIAGIKAGRTWQHLGGDVSTAPRAKITEAMVRAIREDGRTNFDIADHYGLSFQQVSRIKRRERWAHVV